MSLDIPNWSATELDLMRIGLGLTTVWAFMTAAALRPDSGQLAPVGIARFVNIGWMGSRQIFRFVQFVACAAALFFAADMATPYAVSVMAVAMLINVTFVSSQGSVNHGSHLLLIVLLAEASGYGAHALFAESDKAEETLFASTSATASWWAIQAIAAAYFASGLTKLVNSRGRWVQNSPGLLMDALSRQETWALLGSQPPKVLERAANVTDFLLRHIRIAQMLFAAGLLIELSAPLGLCGVGILALVGIGLIALHMANGLLLGLSFPLYQLLVLTFYVNPAQLWS